MLKLLEFDHAIGRTKKDGWIGNFFKEREVIKVIHERLAAHEAYDEKDVTLNSVLELIKNQDEYR